MNSTILQVPLPKTLKDSATIVAKEYGFSSLQEILRVILNKLARRELTMTISEQKSEFIKLSSAAKRRYKKMTEDFKKGRNVYYSRDVDDFLRQLNS